VQKKHVSLFLGEVLQGCVESASCKAAFSLDLRRVCGARLTVRLNVGRILVSPVAPNVIDKAVVSDSIKKGRELGGRLIAAACLDDLAPDIMENILSGVEMEAK